MSPQSRGHSKNPIEGSIVEGCLHKPEVILKGYLIVKVMRKVAIKLRSYLKPTL